MFPSPDTGAGTASPQHPADDMASAIPSDPDAVAAVCAHVRIFDIQEVLGMPQRVVLSLGLGIDLTRSLGALADRSEQPRLFPCRR